MRMRRAVAVSAAVAVVLALALLALAHTPPVRARAFAWVTRTLDTSFGLILTADTFRYNLFTGGATLTNVRLAAKGHEAQPFFSAARVQADLTLAAYAGSLILDDVAVEGGRVEVLADADGVSNLPGDDTAEEPPVTPRTLVLRGLHLDDFALLYDDRSGPLRIAATGIDAALDHRAIRVFEGITGPFAVRGGVDVQWGERALRVDPIDSRLAFDGSRVSMQDLPLSLHLSQGLSPLSGLGTVSVSGRVTRVLDAPALELTFDGQVNVAEAATWAPPPMPVAGTTHVKGSLVGPAGSPEIAVRFDAAALTLGTERNLTAGGELLIDTERLTANRVVASPASGGQVEAAFDVPFGDAPPTASATWEGVDARVFLRVANVDERPIGARLDGQARFAGGDEPQLAVRADFSAIRERGVTPLDGRIEMGVRGTRWTLTHTARTGGLSTTGSAGGRLDADAVMNSTIAGPVTVTVTSLAAASDSLAPHGLELPAAIREMTGAIDADVTLAGTLASPRATIETRAPALALPGLGEAEVTATVEADPSRVLVSPLSVTRGDTHASGEVAIDVDRRTLSGSLHARALDARALQDAVPEEWRVAGPLAAEASISGTFDAPLVDVTLSSPALQFAGETLEDLDGRARITGEGVEVSSLSIRQRAGAVRAAGRYGFDRTYTLELDVNDLVWSGALVGDAETTAFVNGRFTGSGSVDRPQGTGQFRFMLAGGVAGDLIGTGTMDVVLTGDQARVSALVPSLGAFAHGTVALASPYDYRGVAVLNRVDLATATPLIGAAPGELTGQVTLTAAAHGAFGGDATPQVAANVQTIDALVAGVPLTLTTPAAVTWQPGELAVRDFTARLGSGTLVASGERTGRDNTVFNAAFRGELAEAMTAAKAFGFETDIVASGPVALDLYSTGRTGDIIASVDLAGGRVELSPDVVFSDLAVNANLTGEALTLYALSAQVAAEKASGRFSASGNATIPGLDPMRATGTVHVDTAAFDAAGIDVTQARPSTISIDNGIVRMDDVVWQAAGSALRLGGGVDLTKEEATLDLSLTGVAVLRVLSAFVPTLAIDGTADVDVRVRGTASTPELTGRMQVNNAELALSSPRLVVSELSGPIAFTGDRIELRGLTGSANGGALVTDGGVVLKGTEIVDAEIAVQVQGMAVEYPRGLRSEVDALVTYSIEDAGPILTGDVRVLRSSYSEPISLAALARASTTTGPVTTTSALDDLRLNVAITTVEDMRVDNNYGRFEGGAQVRLVGTVGEPGLTGRATLREGGTVYAAGRTFTLNRGAISFTNLERIEPDLDIQAQTRVGGQGDVTLTVQGTPARMTVDLASTEGGSQEEIATALFGGGVTTGNAFTLLSSELLGVTGQRLGLDALRLDVGAAQDEFREDPGLVQQDIEDPTTRLTLSKRIRDNVEFTVSQNLRESGRATFLVSYFPIGNFELRAVSRDDSSFGFGFRHQVVFGGADTSSAVVVPRTEVQVARVGFEGDLAPLTERELGEMTRIRAGEPFSFYDWQRDLDHLTATYVDRGHFEARVRGRRVDRPDGSIEVVYAVSRGPATRVVVEGAQIPASETEAIREAWTRAVFDRFLVQDAENRLRRYLLASGHVEGKVSGAIEMSGDTKTLHLTVEEGARTERRDLLFRGNDAVADGELELVLVQSGLELEAWLDPDAAVTALTAFYRDEGYLQARVEVAARTPEVGPGVLAIDIVEGPRALVSELRLEGVSDSERPLVERAIDVAPPEPYTALGMDAARDRVARHYRQRGFNGVQVTAAASPSADAASVGLAFTVVEGPRQVLREVVTSGATRTREGIVDRALRLHVGQPVNLEEWSMARKRLFDTNVFRAVDIQAVPMGESVEGEQDVRAVVTVEEYPPWRVRYGVQADRKREDVVDAEDPQLTTRLGVTGEIRNQNLFGRALTTGASTLIERDFQRGNLFFSNASFFGLPVRSNVSAYRSRENLRFESEVFAVSDDVGVSFEQRMRRRRGFEITYGYRFERNRTFDPDPNPDDPFPLDAVTNLGRLTSAALLERRDDPVNSTRGSFSSVSFEQTAPALGADVRYSKVLAQQYLFVPLGGVVLASRVVAGGAFGPDEPIDKDRFYAGGGNSVRGYAERALGPQDVLFGSPLGGTSLIVLNQEIRFPIYRWLRGVGFLDAGNVFYPEAPNAEGGLKIGYGAGVRIDSPVGLLRVDFGIPGSTLSSSSRSPNQSASGRWYFGIGHVF